MRRSDAACVAPPRRMRLSSRQNAPRPMDGISPRVGPLFSASGKFANFIRISSARVWDARLERGLQALAKLL